MSPVDFPQLTVSHISTSPNSSALPVLLLGISNPHHPGTILHPRVFVDCGAQRTLIHPSLVAELKLEAEGSFVCGFESFNHSETPRLYNLVRFVLHLNEDLLEVTAVVNPEVGKPVYIQGYSKAINTLSKEGLQMADPNPSDTLQDIQLILGVDYMPLLFKRKVHFLGVELFDTAVGHVVWGQLPQWTREPEPPRAPAISMKQFFANVDTPLEPNVENLWSLESVGITFEEHSHLETKTIQFFKETVRKLPTGYSIKLPFKSSDRPALNYARAIAQLNSLKTKADAKFIFEKYQAILKDYVEQDFIEVVPDGSTPDVCGLVHYLPHHPVYKQSSTTPMRIVFNASAKERKGSLSLNDTLYTGPNLAIKIAKMILAFRSQTFGVLADISKAFLRVRIEETDRDYCRFLFFADEHFSQIVKYRFKRVCFGATSSPYLLNQTIQHHLDTLDTPLTARL